MNDILDNGNKYLVRLIDELERNGKASYGSIENARDFILKYLQSMPTANSQSELYELQVYAQQINNENETVDASRIISSLKRINGGVDALTKLRNQKVVSEEHLNNIEVMALERLEKKSLVHTLEIVDGDTRKTYYALSAKGRQIFKDKSVFKKIREIIPGYTIPAWDIFSDEIATSEYYLQAICIYEYMQKSEASEYFTFTFPKCEDMIFACAVTDADKCWYCCAPNRILDENEKNYLIEIADSVDITDIKVVGYSNSAIERLEACINEGYSKISDKIRFCSLEDIDG